MTDLVALYGEPFEGVPTTEEEAGRLFRCEALKVTMLGTGCAKRWMADAAWRKKRAKRREAEARARAGGKDAEGPRGLRPSETAPAAAYPTCAGCELGEARAGLLQVSEPRRPKGTRIKRELDDCAACGAPRQYLARSKHSPLARYCPQCVTWGRRRCRTAGIGMPEDAQIAAVIEGVPPQDVQAPRRRPGLSEVAWG